MPRKKSWKAITPELFKIGTIEFHTNSADLVKRMRKREAKVEDDYMQNCAGAVIYNALESHGILYIYVGDGKITTLTHECFHATVRFLAYAGVPLETDAPNETYAYFLEHLVGEFLPLIKKGKR